MDFVMAKGGSTDDRRDAHYAVVVGIDQYLHASVLPPLHGASADAHHFVEWLLSPTGGGLDAAQVRALTTAGVRVGDFKSPPMPDIYEWQVGQALAEVNEEMITRIKGTEPAVFERSRLYV